MSHTDTFEKDSKEQLEAWQKFEAEYKISDNWSAASQIIFMAFEAGLKADQKQLLTELMERKVYVTYKEDDGHGIAVPLSVLQEYIERYGK